MWKCHFPSELTEPGKALFLAIDYTPPEPLTCSFTRFLEFDTGWACFYSPLGQKLSNHHSNFTFWNGPFSPKFLPPPRSPCNTWANNQERNMKHTARQPMLPMQTMGPLVMGSWSPTAGPRPANNFAQASKQVLSEVDSRLSQAWIKWLVKASRSTISL